MSEIIHILISMTTGNAMHELVRQLYPITRSITGNGVRETLQHIAEHIPVELHEVATGTNVFDWTVPKEWNIADAYIKNEQGERIVDFKKSNLHVVSYSVPVKQMMSLSELRPHLFSLPEYPDRIPYRTSYYSESWGFCLRHEDLVKLPEGTYEVCIDSKLSDGSLTYGEYVLQGETEEEILISSHICHPSLANDNLSGIVLATFLAKALQLNPHRKYTYRFLFIPGTIGSIAWLATHQEHVKKIMGGLVLTGVGDSGLLHYKKSRMGNSRMDAAATAALQESGLPHGVLDFSPFGYDERQYCSPGFNLPVGSLMRTPHGTYAEYHTSADNIDFVSPKSREEGLALCQRIFAIFEGDVVYRNQFPFCEPQLGKRGLYEAMGQVPDEARQLQLAMLWVLNLSDGEHSLLSIAQRSGMEFSLIRKAANLLVEHAIIL